MSDAFRRIYNKVDTLFDRRAILREMSFSHHAENVNQPVTAGQAFQSIRTVTHRLDREARLKLMVSQKGTNNNGVSSHWEFFFDLPKRRAKLTCEWILPWNQSSDHYEPAKLDFKVRPFPPLDSPIRQLVREGKLLHRQMIGMWKQEYKRLPDLPKRFRDTDIVLADFLQQGLDITQTEFSLRTGQSPQNQLCWIAETRNATYYADFVYPIAS